MHLTLNFKSNSCQLTELSSVFLVFASFHGEVCPVSSAVSRRPLRHTTWPQPGHWERTVLCRLPHFKIKSSSQTNLRPSEEGANRHWSLLLLHLYILMVVNYQVEGKLFNLTGFLWVTSCLRSLLSYLSCTVHKQNPWLWLVVGSRTPQRKHPKSDLCSRAWHLRYLSIVGFDFLTVTLKVKTISILYALFSVCRKIR